jgi:hypothetical protein
MPSAIEEKFQPPADHWKAAKPMRDLRVRVRNDPALFREAVVTLLMELCDLMKGLAADTDPVDIVSDTPTDEDETPKRRVGRPPKATPTEYPQAAGITVPDSPADETWVAPVEEE